MAERFITLYLLGIPVSLLPMQAAPVQLIRPKRHSDARGWFAEIYNSEVFEEAGITCTFVQDNHSFSAAQFTLRGLHFQTAPFSQAKLVRCIRGRIFDVIVDIRDSSPTYGRWISTELSAANGHALFVPIGFAHGFLTLEPECEVIYKCSASYSPSHDKGVSWNDPTIGIHWPVPLGATPVLSAKDQAQPSIAEIGSPFPFDGFPLAPLPGRDR